MVSLKGRKQTPEHKIKRIELIRNFHKVNPGYFKGERNPNYGRKMSQESKSKLSNSQKRRLVIKGIWNKGKAFKHRGTFQKGHKYLGGESGQFTTERVKGEKNINWQGGISFNPYPKYWTNSLKKSIRERDNHICYICKNKGKHIHHINYNKNDCHPENLITLCSSCHIRTNRNREYWEGFFNGRSI